ncbi:MAG: hypothetical protein IPI67_25345 [Myxococcales bacterium]|nr:hypothetical protein [Myxococcales bacterium]
MTSRVGRASLALTLGLSLLGAAGVAEAAKVKGKVVGFRGLVNPVWDEARDPKKRGYSFREIVPTVRPEFRHLFPHIPKELCIVALAESKQAPQKTAILIRVGGGRTTPVTIVVPAGQQLQFHNTDPFKHRLFGVGVSTFLPGDTIKGARRDWTASAPGSYEIRDEAAPSLRMWVIAEPNVAGIAYPNLKGEFALPVTADGKYTVQAYFAGKKVGPAVPVEVKGGDIDLKEALKVAEEKKPEKKTDDKDKDKEAKDKGK